MLLDLLQAEIGLALIDPGYGFFPAQPVSKLVQSIKGKQAHDILPAFKEIPLRLKYVAH